MKTVQRLWWACSLLIAASALIGCRNTAPPEDTKPTAANPQPYPGMEEARARGGTLRLPRDHGGSGADGK